MEKKSEYVAVILSGATTIEAACQLLENAEKGNIREGMLLLVETSNKPILARVAQIVPYNAFYTEGDPFSEARRKDLQIPEEVARRYEVCKLDLLIEVPKSEIKYPPQPGDHVKIIEPQKNEKEIFGVARGDPKHVWFGSLSGYDDAPIPLNIENIPMHLAIFGVTGSGKSFSTGALIEKLAEIPVNKNSSVSYPMIIIDAHGDYIDYIDSGKSIGEIGWFRRYVFPQAYASPDMRTTPNIRPIGLNLDLLSHRELAEMIMLFHKGTLEGAEQQITYTDLLFEHMSEIGFASIHNLFLHNFTDLLTHLETLAGQVDMHPSTKSAIRRALENFLLIEDRHSLLSTVSDLQQASRTSGGAIERVNFIDDITRQGGVAIIDFSADAAPGVDLPTKQLVMTYLAALLFEQFTAFKIRKEDRYLMFVIEEAQFFAPDKSYPVSSSLAHKKLSDIATQGRKFGLTLCLISQRPSFVDKIVLSMCNTFFIHRMSPEDVSFVRSASGGLQSSIASKLTTLNTGDLIVTGQMNSVPFPLLLHVPRDSRKVKPTRGATNVVDSLAKLRGIV